MKPAFQFADLHCHPNLKTFGHSFRNSPDHPKQDLWFTEQPGAMRRWMKSLSGITRFSQCDFSTMAKGGSKIAVVSLYPFEKGFFINAAGSGAFSAVLCDWITGIGYERIRHLQQHTNYFEDLCREYDFFIAGRKTHRIGDQEYQWRPTTGWTDVAALLDTPNAIAVVLSIEGAHVFNTGLEKYGVSANPEEVLHNIKTVKNWAHPPLFITFAHNFNNDLCGHARSLDPLKPFVDQNKNLDAGFTPLGEAALDALLDTRTGRRIYIDLKHMSLAARQAYYAFLQGHGEAGHIPIIVSHGAAAGIRYNGVATIAYPGQYFNTADINFFDEEIVAIARSGGLFAVQFDSRRIASREMLATISRNIYDKDRSKKSARIVWNQIRHVAALLDRHNLYAWGTACIGSDFDGTINPMNGILTVQDFQAMAEELLLLADQYLKTEHGPTLAENRQISPEEIVERFCLGNTARFLERHY